MANERPGLSKTTNQSPELVLNLNIFPILAPLRLRGQSQECVISVTFLHLKYPSSGGFHFQTNRLGSGEFPKCGMFQLHQDAEYLIVIINWRIFWEIICFSFLTKPLRYPGILMIHHQKKLDTKILQIIKLSLHLVIQSSSDSECSQQCHDPDSHQGEKKVKH